MEEYQEEQNQSALGRFFGFFFCTRKGTGILGLISVPIGILVFILADQAEQQPPSPSFATSRIVESEEFLDSSDSPNVAKGTLNVRCGMNCFSVRVTLCYCSGSLMSALRQMGIADDKLGAIEAYHRGKNMTHWEPFEAEVAKFAPKQRLYSEYLGFLGKILDHKIVEFDIGLQWGKKIEMKAGEYMLAAIENTSGKMGDVVWLKTIEIKPRMMTDVVLANDSSCLVLNLSSR